MTRFDVVDLCQRIADHLQADDRRHVEPDAVKQGNGGQKTKRQKARAGARN